MGRRLQESDTTILVVDDDPEVRELVSEYLRDFGYNVLEADSGTKALGVVGQQKVLHLIITDIRMPEMSGLELAELAAQQNRDLKIIFMSGYFSPQQVGQRFLHKPFRLSELEAAVRTELAN
ncbi:MAG: response regulator [Alphaproteobacteria bacterium]|nr:response regulator [Rhodospirillales bacterium]MBN9563973.1 response regulator [Alphaproteobacteria bacterium]